MRQKREDWEIPVYYVARAHKTRQGFVVIINRQWRRPKGDKHEQTVIRQVRDLRLWQVEHLAIWASHAATA